jgi:hypothetical protein
MIHIVYSYDIIKIFINFVKTIINTPLNALNQHMKEKIYK